MSFLLEKIHKEDIERSSTTIIKGNQLNEQCLFSSIYRSVDKSNKQEMLNKLEEYMENNLNSVVSNLFLGCIKTKINCKVCKNTNYNFSPFCFVVFDLTKSEGEKTSFDLKKDGFDKERIERYIPNYILLKKEEHHIFCESCLTEQDQLKFVIYYYLKDHLIINFYRGNNYESKIKVTFTHNLNLYNVNNDNEKTIIESNNSPHKFALIGCITRVVNNGEEKFCYFTKHPKENKWITSFGEKDTIPIEEMQNSGQVILLFYNAVS